MAHYRILIVNSPYYAHISEELEKGAREALEASDDECDVETIMVPGAFEVPGAIAMAADSALPGVTKAVCGVGAARPRCARAVVEARRCAAAPFPPRSEHRA